LLGTPDAEILSFDEGTVHPISYEETDSYRITSLFINQRERLLKQLLQEEEE
jgi:predicted ATPase